MADRSLVLIAFYAALIAALGLVPPVQIAFLGGVPITAQSLGVMLAGVMLGPVRGTLAVLLFLLIVCPWCPVPVRRPWWSWCVCRADNRIPDRVANRRFRHWLHHAGNPFLAGVARGGICGCRWWYRYRLSVRRTGDHACGRSAAGQGSSGKHDLHSRRPGKGCNRSLCC